MSKSSVRHIVVLLFLAFGSVALVIADLGVLAQNTNSSTTTEDTSAQDENTNANVAPRRSRRRGRRGRRGRRAAAAAATADTSGQGGMDAGGTSGGETQTDLSGTYTGTINCLDMSGDATLTITGNQFTLAAGSSNRSGRILAVTTRGYTGVALRFDDGAGGGTPPASGSTTAPTTVSARARHSGDRLTLSPVPNEPNACSFTPAGGQPRRGAGMGRRRRRGR